MNWLAALVMLLWFSTGTVAAPAQSGAMPTALGRHAAQSSSRLMLVILTPGLTLDDWLSMPHLRQMMDEGAVGIMNTRTARMPSGITTREPGGAAILTLGAGARAAWPPDPGMMPSPEAGRTNEWAAKIRPAFQAINQGLGYDVHIGNLADALDNAGIPFLASTDLDDLASTLSNPTCESLLTMRSRGTAVTSSSSTLPGCYVVCLDGGRRDSSTLPRIDDAVDKIVQPAAASHARILIISPYVNDWAYSIDDRLAPVLLLGDGVPNALLYSRSTRRPGLITNTDIAPTIAAYFGATLPSTPFGRPVTVQRVDNPLQEIRQIRYAALEQRAGQKALPYCAIVLGLCLMILAMAQRFAGWLEMARYFVSAFLPWLVLTLVVTRSIPNFLLYFSVVAAAVTSIRRNHTLATLFTIPIAGIGFLELLNTMAGGGVLASNLLGYSPIEGARYYGIGNEAMGAMAGGLLVAISHLWTILQPHPHHPGEGRSRRIALIVGMLAVIAIVGAPSMGAKAGGVIVLTGAFATFLMSGYGRRLGLGGIVAATLLGLLALTSMALLDGARSSTSQSHLGAAVSLIHHGGIGQALDIVTRKMAVELKLATHSTWALPVWAGLACLLLQRRAAARWKVDVDDAIKVRPRIALLDSTLVAALLMLLFNDAGAVACALCLSVVCSYVAVPDLQARIH